MAYLFYFRQNLLNQQTSGKIKVKETKFQVLINILTQACMIGFERIRVGILHGIIICLIYLFDELLTTYILYCIKLLDII